MKKTQQLGTSLLGLPIFERATLLPLARIEKVILQPATLTLAYFAARDTDEGRQYIRCSEVAPVNGWLTTNRSENFGEAEDFLRDAELLKLDCTLFDYHVRDTSKKSLGAISDYSFSLPDLQLTRLYIKRPIWQRFKGEQLILPKSHVVDVLPAKQLIIVQPLDKQVRQAAVKAIPA